MGLAPSAVPLWSCAAAAGRGVPLPCPLDRSQVVLPPALAQRVSLLLARFAPPLDLGRNEVPQQPARFHDLEIVLIYGLPLVPPAEIDIILLLLFLLINPLFLHLAGSIQSRRRAIGRHASIKSLEATSEPAFPFFGVLQKMYVGQAGPPNICRAFGLPDQ